MNVAYAQALTWANPTLARLEDQALVPMYGEHPIELGLDRSDRWIEEFRHDPVYQRLFAPAFRGEPDPFTRSNVVKALASFQRAIVSARSPYVRYHFERDDAAVSDAAKRGEILFHSRPLSWNTGLYEVTHEPRDVGKFKAPTLRNIAGTAPYMHDGSVATLEDALACRPR